MSRRKQVATAVVGVGLIALTAAAVGTARPASHGMTATAGQPTGLAQAGSYRHEFRGKVTTLSRNNSWFRIRTSQSGLVRIGVAHATSWNDCSWGAMQVGRHVDVHAYRHNGSWIASTVAPWQGNWHDDWGDDWGH